MLRSTEWGLVCVAKTHSHSCWIGMLPFPHPNMVFRQQIQGDCFQKRSPLVRDITWCLHVTLCDFLRVKDIKGSMRQWITWGTFRRYPATWPVSQQLCPIDGWRNDQVQQARPSASNKRLSIYFECELVTKSKRPLKNEYYPIRRNHPMLWGIVLESGSKKEHSPL